LHEEPPVTNTPAESTNLVLEQLRVTRAQTNGRFDRLEAEIGDLKKDIRGFKLNTIAEIYKAN
jgi:hypothetical protein